MHPDFTVITAPERTPLPAGRKSVFLAGSIDMGKAENWQSWTIARLSHLPVTVLNPRREDFDPFLVQDISNPPFVEQVEWELDHLDLADVIAVYFDPQGQAPITIGELGLHARSKKCIVCCPPGFWRRGNIQIICHRYGIPLVSTYEAFSVLLLQRLLDHPDAP